jgi:hypothetical protein
MLYGATFSLNCFPAENAGTLYVTSQSTKLILKSTKLKAGVATRIFRQFRS